MKLRQETSRAATPEQHEELEFVNGIHTVRASRRSLQSRETEAGGLRSRSGVGESLLARTRSAYSGRLERRLQPQRRCTVTLPTAGTR
jgi:hypothetical protein